MLGVHYLLRQRKHLIIIYCFCLMKTVYLCFTSILNRIPRNVIMCIILLLIQMCVSGLLLSDHQTVPLNEDDASSVLGWISPETHQL